MIESVLDQDFRRNLEIIRKVLTVSRKDKMNCNLNQFGYLAALRALLPSTIAHKQHMFKLNINIC